MNQSSSSCAEEVWYTMVQNKLIPIRTATEWTVCINYSKLNAATQKDLKIPLFPSIYQLDVRKTERAFSLLFP